MSELIAAKAKGELLERYQAGKPPDEADETESEYVRELLDDGLAAREQSLYERVGLPARLGAQLEQERRTGETEADVIREVLEDGVEARRGDVLASEELRAAVEERREEAESLDDAARRLLREGVAATADRKPTARARVRLGLYGATPPTSALALAAAAVIAAGWGGGVVAGVVAILAWGLAIAYADVVAGAFVRLQERVGGALGRGPAGGA